MPGTLRRVGALELRQWPALALTLLGALAAALVVWLSIRRLRPGHRHSAAASIRLDEGERVRSLRPLAARPVLLAAIWRLGLPKGYGINRGATATLLLGPIRLGWRLLGEITERYRNPGRITGHNLYLLSPASGIR